MRHDGDHALWLNPVHMVGNQRTSEAGSGPVSGHVREERFD